MKKYTLVLIISILYLSACNKKSSNYQTLDGFAQGGTYHIVYKISGDNLDAKNNISNSLPDSLTLYLEQINKSVSGYDSLSIVSRINRGEDIALDSIFIENFNASLKVYQESNGAFDISAAPFFDIWGFGFKNKEKINQNKIDSIKAFVGMRLLSLKDSIVVTNGDAQMKDNLSGRKVETFLKKADKRMKVNFNAIAQGYTCDYIAKKFDKMGISDYLIEVGGEIICKGANAKGAKWRVAIDKPLDGNFIPGEQIQGVIELQNNGMVTSGNYRKFYIEDGVKYSHTIDPATGYPVKHNLLSATVIAPNATIADAYATYFMVVGLEKAKEILKSRPEMGAILVYGDQKSTKVYSHNCSLSDK